MTRLRRGLGFALREASALFTQARYLARDLGESRRAGRGPTVVLVHGLYASAGVFRPLRTRLHEELDATTLSFSYATGPGIIELSGRLSALLAGESSPSPIHLIGHSLGGLISRYYVQEMRPDPRVIETVSLGAPFLGSARADWVWGPAREDIRIGGDLLRQISLGTPQGERIPHLSIVAEEDVLIEPEAFPAFGERLSLPRVGHNGLLFDPRVLDLLVQRIRSW